MAAEAGPRDAAVPTDAGGDAVPEDAGADASSEDGGGLPEGGHADASGSDAGAGTMQCAWVGEGLLEVEASQEGRPVLAVDAEEDTLHVLYGAAGCRMGPLVGQGLRALRVPSHGDIDMPVDVVNTDPLAGCFESLAPALVARVGGAAVGYFATGNAGRFELYAQALSPTPELSPPGRRLTFDDAAVREREYATAAVSLGDAPLIAWAAERGTDKARALFTMRPDGAAPPIEILSWDVDRQPRALVLAALNSFSCDGLCGRRQPRVPPWRTAYPV